MTNFGILMEIKGIEKPFDWSRNVVQSINKEGTGLYYSPSRRPSTTSEGIDVSAIQINKKEFNIVRSHFKGYFKYIEDFISDMKIVFPNIVK